jgi:hypothetical protein
MHKRRGDIDKIGGWGGSIMRREGEIGFFSWHHSSSDAQFLLVAAP